MKVERSVCIVELFGEIRVHYGGYSFPDSSPPGLKRLHLSALVYLLVHPHSSLSKDELATLLFKLQEGDLNKKVSELTGSWYSWRTWLGESRVPKSGRGLPKLGIEEMQVDFLCLKKACGSGTELDFQEVKRIASKGAFLKGIEGDWVEEARTNSAKSISQLALDKGDYVFAEDYLTKTLKEGGKFSELLDKRLEAVKERLKRYQGLIFVHNECGDGTQPSSHEDLPFVRIPARPFYELTRWDILDQIRLHLKTSRLGNHGVCLTLKGMGGIGKTHLALQFIYRSYHQYHDGILWVEVDSHLPLEQLEFRLAQELGLSINASKSRRDQLIEFLKPKSFLLILDSCERSLSSCSELVRLLLLACPNLHLFVTSQAPLKIREEKVIQVPPLAYKGEGSQEDKSPLPAVLLFKNYAAPQLENDDVTLGEIVALLEGVPLSLRLAASRLKQFTPPQLLHHLKEEGRFSVLVGGSRDPARQETLFKTIAWSHQLLTPPQQYVFRRIVFFKFSFTLEAAEAVCAGQDISRGDVSIALEVLAEGSFLETNDQYQSLRRYRLLDTLSDYGKRLLEEGEETEIHHRLLRFYHDCIDRIEGDSSLNAGLWFEEEQATLRGILQWLLDKPGLAGEGLHLAGRLGFFWMLRGYYGDGVFWLETFLGEVGREAPLSLRAQGLHQLGSLKRRLGENETARHCYEEAEKQYLEEGNISKAADVRFNLAILCVKCGEGLQAQQLIETCLPVYEQFQSSVGIARCMNALGAIAYDQGDYKEAHHCYQAGLAQFGEQRHGELVADLLTNLGNVAWSLDDLEKAQQYYTEALEVYKALSHEQGNIVTRTNLSEILIKEGRYEEALTNYGELLPLARNIKDQPTVASLLHLVGEAHCLSGNFPRAKSDFLACIDLSCKIDSKPVLIKALEGYAWSLTKTGDESRAVTLTTSLEGVRQTLNQPLAEAEAERRNAWLETCRNTMEKPLFDFAVSQGESLTLEQLVTYAQQGEPNE